MIKKGTEEKKSLDKIKKGLGITHTETVARICFKFTAGAIDKGVLPNDKFVPLRVLEPLERLLYLSANGAAYPNLDDIKDALAKVSSAASFLTFGPIFER